MLLLVRSNRSKVRCLQKSSRNFFSFILQSATVSCPFFISFQQVSPVRSDIKFQLKLSTNTILRAMSSNNPTSYAQDEPDKQSREFNIDTAIEVISAIIDGVSDMYYDVKKVKYDYLLHTNELFNRIDFPSLMMESARKEINKGIPSAKSIEKMEI